MKDGDLFRKVGMARMRLGMGVGADDVAMVLRSLPTMKLRFDRTGASSLIVADWLKSRLEVDKILHPAYPDCPGHEFFKRDFTGTGGLFSFVFHEKYTGEQIDRFIESLTLFGLGYSWGGTHSLAVPYAISDKRINWKLSSKKGSLMVRLDEKITASILEMLDKGCEMVFCSGGMSVDPDDKTPLAIKNTGANIISYGSPVLPGAMFLGSYYEGKQATGTEAHSGRVIPILGLPGCVMYAKRTVFDLLLPRILAGDRLTAEDISAYGEGGLCLNCGVCHFPNCGFGE